METAPKKKGSGLGIVLVIVLALGIGTAVAYTMRKKSSGAGSGGEAGGGAAQKTIAPDSPESGYTPEANAQFAEHRIATSKVVLTAAQQQAIRDNPAANIQLSAEQAAQLKEHKTKKITGQMQNDTGDISYSSFYNGGF
jgi:hypothetical protein